MTKCQFLTAMITMSWVGPTFATSIDIQLTPETTRVGGLVFKVVSRDIGEGKEVAVGITADTDKDLSPFLSALLEVHKGKRLVLSCPVEKKEQGGELLYQFYVSELDVGKVRFRFNEYGFTKVKGKDGDDKIVPMPAVTSYWLNLDDFVAGRVEALPTENKARTLLIGLVVLGAAFYVAIRRGKRGAAAKEIPS